jgi:outer membrane protein TolC
MMMGTPPLRAGLRQDRRRDRLRRDDRTRGRSPQGIDGRFLASLALGAAFFLLASPLFGAKDPGTGLRGSLHPGTEPGEGGSKPTSIEPASDEGAADETRSGSSGSGAGTAGSAPAELALTVRDAVLLALEHNGSLELERLDNAATKTFELEERGAFDPVLTGDAGYSISEVSAGSGYAAASAGVSLPLPSGTEVAGEVSLAAGDRVSPGFSAELSQELLEGGRRAANLAGVKQAEIDIFSSDYELRGFTAVLVASVESAYWDELSAELRVEIFDEGLRIAERQLEETRERVDVGTIPAIELIAARAEVALRREALLEAVNIREKARLTLLSLLNLPGDSLYDTRVVTLDRPVKPAAGADDLDAHLASALAGRADLRQAMLAREKGELEVMKTKNGLLPRLELFISLGKTAYADSFSGSPAANREDLTLDASLAFSLPIGNRRDRALSDRAVLTLRQTETAIQNLRRLIELDVRSAYLDAGRTRDQIDMTAVSRSLQEEKLAAETEKFRVGRSTALLVAQSQRDLLDSKIAEEEALIGHLKSLIDLYRLDGSLLRRRGIEAPSGTRND